MDGDISCLASFAATGFVTTSFSSAGTSCCGYRKSKSSKTLKSQSKRYAMSSISASEDPSARLGPQREPPDADAHAQSEAGPRIVSPPVHRPRAYGVPA